MCKTKNVLRGLWKTEEPHAKVTDLREGFQWANRQITQSSASLYIILITTTKQQVVLQILKKTQNMKMGHNSTITIIIYVLFLVARSCPTLWDPLVHPLVHSSAPGSSVHGDSPGRNTAVGCHALLQGIFPTQGSNPGLPHCRQILSYLWVGVQEAYWNKELPS